MPTYKHPEIELEELDPNLYAPDGDPWCRFGKGFQCLNGDDCLNHNRRPKRSGLRGDGDQCEPGGEGAQVGGGR